MSNAVSNLKDTIIPRSDQLNSEQLLSGPITITVTGVDRGNAEQPVIVHYANEDGRPYKPCKSMRKVLIFAWGEDGNAWIGRSMTLYNKPDVKFGGVEVGGIRISHLSHIEADLKISLTATRGKKDPYAIKRMAVQSAPDIEPHKRTLSDAARKGMAALQSAWGDLPKDVQRAIGGGQGCPQTYKDIATAADNPPPVSDAERLNAAASQLPPVFNEPETVSASGSDDDGIEF